MEEIIVEEEDINLDLPEIPITKEKENRATSLVEVALFKVRDNSEEFTISGDKIIFIPRLEMLKVENLIETQEYPNSTRRDNSLIIKSVILFTKVNQ